MATITLSSSDPTGVSADVLVVGLSQGADGPVLLAGADDVDAAFDGALVKELVVLGAKGRADEVTRLTSPAGVAAPVVLAVGVGKVGMGRVAEGIDPEQLRKGAGAAARALSGSDKAVVALPADTAVQVAAVAEGLGLGAYAFSRYKQNGVPLGAAVLITALAKDKAAKTALKRAVAVADAVRQVRDWVNTPPSDLTPKAFADEVLAATKGLDLEVEVLDEKALKKGGYGGLVGVGQGSVNPPRLVRVAYRSRRATTHVALVGKGITFDSGGLSLKPGTGMMTMKCDMAGAASVVAAVIAIAKIAPHVNVTAYGAMAENMPSGTAQRPSDVLTMYGGKTVEVLNTDAEGRLVLADAIVRASEDDPDLIVDIATLTGAALVALGARTAAIMANDDELLGTVHAIATDAGEAMWPLPLPEELRAGLDSQVADLQNIGGRFGGALSAGLFLREFVPEGVRWAHLDIAGPAFNEEGPHGYTPKGGTGAGVRTLISLVEEAAAGTV